MLSLVSHYWALRVRSEGLQEDTEWFGGAFNDEVEVVRDHFKGLDGVLSNRFIPSPSCDLGDEFESLIAVTPWGNLGSLKKESNDFIPSWIGTHPTGITVDLETALPRKKALWKLYSKKKKDCEDSLVQWIFHNDHTSISHSIPLAFYADHEIRNKRSVEIFIIKGNDLREDGIEALSLNYERVAPETIRMRQKGALERRNPLTSPYIVLETKHSLHYHFQKPISNGWTTTPQQIQDEKKARDELRLSEHEHFKFDLLENIINSNRRISADNDLVMLQANESGPVIWGKVNGVLMQKNAPTQEGKETYEPDGIWAIIRKNWVYIFGAYVILSMLSGGEEEPPKKKNKGN